MQTLTLEFHRSGTVTNPNLPGAIFGNYAAYRRAAPIARPYQVAVAEYATAIRPRTIKAGVAAARGLGYDFIDASSVRTAAKNDLREALTSLGCNESEIRWHVRNPGKAMKSLYL